MFFLILYLFFRLYLFQFYNGNIEITDIKIIIFIIAIL